MIREQYINPGRVKKLSPKELRKMQENMQKVPTIQKIEKKYHEEEKRNADVIIKKLEKAPSSEEKIINKNAHQKEKETIWKKLKNYLFTT